MTSKHTMSRTQTSKAKAAQRRRRLALKLQQMRSAKARLAQICANIPAKPEDPTPCRLEISSSSKKDVEAGRKDDQVMGVGSFKTDSTS